MQSLDYEQYREWLDARRQELWAAKQLATFGDVLCEFFDAELASRLTDEALPLALEHLERNHSPRSVEIRELILSEMHRRDGRRHTDLMRIARLTLVAAGLSVVVGLAGLIVALL